jgi:hypothetical protein
MHPSLSLAHLVNPISVSPRLCRDQNQNQPQTRFEPQSNSRKRAHPDEDVVDPPQIASRSYSIDPTDGNNLDGQLPAKRIKLSASFSLEPDTRFDFSIAFDIRNGHGNVQVQLSDPNVFSYSVSGPQAGSGIHAQIERVNEQEQSTYYWYMLSKLSSFLVQILALFHPTQLTNMALNEVMN